MLDFKFLIFLSFCIISAVSSQTLQFPKLNLTVTWQVREESTIFTLAFSVTDEYTKNGWVLIGLNNAEQINGGNAIACLWGTKATAHVYIDGKTLRLFNESNIRYGLGEQVTFFQSNQFICIVERINFDINNFFINSSKNIYLFAASSKTASNFIENAFFANDQIDLEYVPEATSSPETTNLNTTIKQNSTTGIVNTTPLNNTQETQTTTKKPNNLVGWHYFTSLDMTVYWKKSGKTTQFTIEFEKKNDFGWIAVGFNIKPQMNGGNAVMFHIENSSNYTVESVYLDGSTPKSLNESDESYGIKNSSVVYIDSLVFCNFELENFFDQTGYLNSDQKVHLLAAFGNATSAYQYHGPNRDYSKNTYNLRFEIPTTKSKTTTAETIITTNTTSYPKSTTPDMNTLFNDILSSLNGLKSSFDKLSSIINSIFDFLKEIQPKNDSNDAISKLF